MKLCPECGERPQYTSFCTTCARLFRRPAREWDRRLEALERQVIGNIAARHRENEFRQAYAACSSLKELAAKLGKKLRWVRDRRRALGLPAYPHREVQTWVWTDERNAQLAEYAAAGMFAAEIAKGIGRGAYAVQLQAWRLGLKLKSIPRTYSRPRWPDARIEELRKLRADGRSFDECAAALGISRNAIAGAVTRYLPAAAAPLPLESPHATISLPDLRPSGRAARIVSLPSIECCGAPGALR